MATRAGEPSAGEAETAVMAKILGNASCSTSGCHGGAGSVRGVVAKFIREDPHARQVTEEELLRALTSEAQRRAEPQPEPESDYEE